MSDQTLQTEFEFTLPKGYVDDDGVLHKEGRMRLANAADEIQPLKNQEVQVNSSYLTIVLLSRTVTELGSLDTVDESVIQNLFVRDLEYLQAMYERINNSDYNAVGTACPECGERFSVEVETGTPITDESAEAEQGPENVQTQGSEQVLPVDEDDADAQPRDITTVSDAPDVDTPSEQGDLDQGNPSK